ncbi:hypothetical protein V5E97_08005 [Singulisphaera sp. Ch08]|uniref:Metallopeptidase n=1 Tax=Singulisphaera sp. Ch08 TaxID=3120278 RepID=A0AAU7CLR2_9BACT
MGTCLALVATGPAPAGPEVASPPYPPTDRYEMRRVEGWPVLVSKDLIQNEPELAERTLMLLRHQLFQVARRVPAKAVEQLQRIRIWVEERESHTPCMAYHPDANWLREHGMNPEKAGCVELSNARNFLSWTLDQPWMVLHELAHGYHHQFLDHGFDNDEIKTLYEQAKTAQIYQSVLRINGKDDKAYAATNPMEYFAESSEAFFGTNDFYPYVRSELSRHDPKMFGLLATLWGGE